ncbi:sialophorin [Ictidomys tridecemlineatus]|uniref:leukosialin n=1 Tax=Ictidomys tridecemlineatus TaxID=43179 RepID=UPI00068262CD|nr:leukosialin [Ictidomys tridecemlineatus]KAG3259630.1 sialophorin [Ictidomys tridecemlineatus]
MPVALEMALLLLLFGGFWVQVVSKESLVNMTHATRRSSASPVAGTFEVAGTQSFKSNISAMPITSDPKEAHSAGSLVSNPPSSTTFTTSDVTHPQTFTDASTGPPVPEPTPSQEVSTEKSSVLPQTSNATSDPSVTDAVKSSGNPTVTRENMTFDSLDTSNVTNKLPVVMTTSSLETSKETSGPPVTIATSSLEPSNETSGPPVTMTSSSLEPSNETSGLPVTMATISLEPSNETKGHSVTMTTSSLGTSTVTKGPPVTSIKTSASTTSQSSISISTSSPQKSGSNSMLLVPVLVALLVAIVFLALLLLWRRRQKRRTGVLMLNTGGKRNGVVDAWAGPARVPDEEATTTPGGGAGGNKDSRVLETEASGQRPLLTTFFSRRKSRQGSLVLEELKSGSGSNTKGEEEPLVGSEDEAVEAPTSNGPEVGDGAARSSL